MRFLAHTVAVELMDLLSHTGSIFDSTATQTATDSSALQEEVLLLYDELHGRLLRYAVSFGISVQDGEDVLQEVFLALFRHLQAGRPRENLAGWTYRTTHNLSLKRRASVHSELRTVEPEPETGLDLCDEQAGPEENILFHEQHERLQSVFSALPETDRMCLRLRADGLRYREIAATLGISLGSVAASLTRSFERMEKVRAR